MKIRLILKLFFLTIWLPATAQTIDGAYAKALQKKYPSTPSPLCKSCELWINPYFKSIANTAEHRPVVTFYIYTKAHRLEQEALNLPRKGTPAAWGAAYNQPA